MAEVTDDFGRVSNFDKADVDSIASMLKSAVGKAVDYATGKAKTSGDEMDKRFKELVEAMEELGDDVKESLESTKNFVEEVKRAAESMSKRREAKGAPKDSIAEAQREQTRILNMILRNQQKAVADKAAKFTSGGTALASQAPKKSNLKDLGFRPRGTDKIPAMLSPNEFIVNSRGTKNNEPLLNMMNRGYKMGGKVKPAYLSGGSNWDDVLEVLKGREVQRRTEIDGKIEIVLSGASDTKLQRQIEEDYARYGKTASVRFADEYDKNLRRTLSSWVTGITKEFAGENPWARIFKGSVKDITEVRVEMRKLAFQAEGITGEFREAQAEFAKVGDNITGRTGKTLDAFYAAFANNARKGFKDQKAGKKVLESGLKLSTLIGSETGETADLFADWHRELALGAVQMERMANNMQQVARNTGVTGKELTAVMKSSESILKNLRRQGDLTSGAAKNVITAMAEFKKQGFEDTGQRMMGAMSGYSAFQGADEATRRLLQVSAKSGGVRQEDLMMGNVPKDSDKMGMMGKGLNKFMAGIVDVKPEEFDMDMLTAKQRQKLAIALNQFGIQLGDAEVAVGAFKKAQAGVAGTLEELDKKRLSKMSTQQEKDEAEKKMNQTLLSSSMDMLHSVSQVTEKFGEKSLAEVAQILQGDNKYAEEFKLGTKDLATLTSYMSDSTKKSFGLSGDKSQVAAQVAAMDANKQMQLRSVVAAEQLDKAMAAQGKSSQDFAGRMKDAMARGDTAGFKTLAEAMTAANSELQTEEATNVDPMVKLEQTMNKLNETVRKSMSGFVGKIIDLIGSMGLLAIQFGMMATTLYGTVGKDLIGVISQGGLGNMVSSMFGAGGVSGFMTSMSSVFQTALGPALLLLGGIKGVMESSEAKRTKVEGGILGMLTGGAKTGSFMSSTLGIKKDSVADKTLGVAGGAAWGAAVGGAMGMLFPPIAPVAAGVGAVVGGVAEMVKIITYGTDILQDIFGPVQVIVDYISGALSDIWSILKNLVSLNFGAAIQGIFNIIGRTIFEFFRLIFSAINMVIIGLPKLIFRALMMIWNIPKAIMDSIKKSLADLANNKWFGPIFKTLSVAFDAIYDGFMAVWTPIAEIFSGLYKVFDDLGKALFGAGKGGGFLGAIMWGLQKAVWAVSYVISWLLSPIILLAKALGFVLKIVGTMIKAIIAPFQWMYDVLVGHSIVPDLIDGIIGWFARLPIYIFRALTFVPRMIFRAFKRVPANIFAGMKLLVNELPRFLLSILMNGLSYMGTFFMYTLPNILFTFMTGAIKKVGKFIWDTFTYPFRKVRDFLYSIFIGFPKWLFGKLVSIFTDSGTYIKAALVGIVAWFGSGLIGSLGGFISTVTGFFGGLPSLISGGFTSALGKVWSWISGWIPSLGGVAGAVSSVGGKALDLGKSLLPSIKGVASKAFGFVKKLAPSITGVASKAFGFVKKLAPSITGVASKAFDLSKKIFPSITGAASKAFEKLGGISGFIKSHAADYFKKGKGLLSSMISKGAGLFGKVNSGVIKGFFSKAMSMGSGLFGKAGPAVKGFFSKAMSMGSGLFGKAGGGGKGFFSKAMSMGAGLLGKVSGGGKGLLGKAMSMGSGLIGKLGGGKGIMGKAKGLFDKLGGAGGLMSKAKSLMSGDIGGLMESFMGGGGEDGGGEEAGCGCALADTATEQTSLMEGVQDLLTPENLQKGLGFAKDFMSKGKDMFGGILGKGKDLLGGILGKGKGIFGGMASKVGGMFSKGGGLISGLFGGSGIGKAASGLLSKGSGLVGSLFGGGGIGKLASGLMGSGGGIMGSLFGKAGGLLAKVGLGGMGGSLLKKIPGFGALAGAGMAIGNLVKGDVGGALTNLASGIAGAIPGIGPVLSTGIDMFGGTIAKGAGWLASKAWQGAKGFGSAIGGLISKTTGGAKGFGSAVGGLVSKAWQGAKSIGSTLMGGGKGIFGGIASKVGGMFGKGGGLLGGLFGGGAISKVAGSIMGGGGGGIMGSLFGKAGGLLAKAGLGGVGKSLLKKIPGVGAIAGAGFAIADLMKGNVGGALTNLASGIAGAIPGIGPVLSAGIDMFGGTISKGAGWLASKAWGGAKKLGSAVGDLAGKAWGGAKKLGSAVGKLASNAWKGAKGFGGMAMKGLKMAAGFSPLGMAFKAGKGLLGALSGKGGGIGGLLARGAKAAFSMSPFGMVTKAFRAGKGLLGGLFGKSANIGTKVMSTIKGGAGVMGNMFGRAGNFIAKAGLGGVGKSLIKRIPGVGAMAGAGMAVADLMKGNVGGALKNMASGLASSVPLIGPVLSGGIDMFGKKMNKGSGLVEKGIKGFNDKIGEGSGLLGESLKNGFNDLWGSAKSWWDSWWGGEKKTVVDAAKGEDKPEVKPTTATSPQTAQPAVAGDMSTEVKKQNVGSAVQKFQSDELARIEDASNKQVEELEKIREGIKELVSLMKPSAGGVVAGSHGMEPGSTRDPKRPMHAVRFGKMKYGKIGGNANRAYVNNGEV